MLSCNQVEYLQKYITTLQILTEKLFNSLFTAIMYQLLCALFLTINKIRKYWKHKHFQILQNRIN